MSRKRTVELTEQQLAFLRSCLEWTAEQLRGRPADSTPRLGGSPLTAIAEIESVLADAQDIG